MTTPLDETLSLGDLAAYASLIVLVPTLCPSVGSFIARPGEAMMRGGYVKDEQASRVMRQLTARDMGLEMQVFALLVASAYHAVAGATGALQVVTALGATSLLFCSVYLPQQMAFLRRRDERPAKRLKRLQGDDVAEAERLVGLVLRLHLHVSPKLHRCRAMRQRFLARLSAVFIVAIWNFEFGVNAVLVLLLALSAFSFTRGAIRADKDFLVAAQRRTNSRALRRREFDALYLREFDFDRSGWQDNVVGGFMDSEELAIVSALAPTGAVVGLKDPSQLGMAPGAIRLNVHAGDWQARVQDLMKRVRLVVIVASSSSSVLWEIREAAKLPPTRLVLLVPDSMSSSQYEEFRAAVGDQLKLPAFVPARSAITFEASGTPRLFSASRPFRSWNSALKPIVCEFAPAEPREIVHVRRPTPVQWVVEFAVLMFVTAIVLIGMKVAL